MLPAVRRSFGVGLVVLGLVILIGGRVVARQQAPPAAPATSATGAISGVVTDGATGKPRGLRRHAVNCGTN